MCCGNPVVVRDSGFPVREKQVIIHQYILSDRINFEIFRCEEMLAIITEGKKKNNRLYENDYQNHFHKKFSHYLVFFKIHVTVQYLHIYRNLPRSFPSDTWQVTSKNPFQIGFVDGIFTFKSVFDEAARSLWKISLLQNHSAVRETSID